MSDFSGSDIAEATAGGYQAPYCTQLSCFLSNKVGRLLDLLEVFEYEYLTLASFSVVEASDHAVVRLITSDADLSKRLLKRAEIPYSEVDVLCIELDSNEALSFACSLLVTAEINILYAYPLLVRPRGKPVVALHTDDRMLAGNILRRKLFTLLAENDLGDNASGSDPAEGGCL